MHWIPVPTHLSQKVSKFCNPFTIFCSGQSRDRLHPKVTGPPHTRPRVADPCTKLNQFKSVEFSFQQPKSTRDTKINDTLFIEEKTPHNTLKMECDVGAVWTCFSSACGGNPNARQALKQICLALQKT